LKGVKKKKPKKEKKNTATLKSQDDESNVANRSESNRVAVENSYDNESSADASKNSPDAGIEEPVSKETSAPKANTSDQGMGHEFSIPDPLAQKLTFTEAIGESKDSKGKEVVSQKTVVDQNTLSEIKALRDKSLRLSSNGLSKKNGLELNVEKKSEKPKTAVSSSKTATAKSRPSGKAVTSPEKKTVGKTAKRKNKSTKKVEDSKPLTKTSRSRPTSKNSTPRSEKREGKCRLHHQTNQSMSCPRPLSESQKKKVTIDMSRNMAVGHRELKISTESPFSPSKRPNKSALKTSPCTHRCKAKDFF